MFIPILLVLIAMSGVALGLGMAYNRKAELHGLAKAAALAAAGALNGTPEGVVAAQTKAREVAEGLVYQYRLPVRWNDSALSFSGGGPDRAGVWIDAARAKGSPAAIFYVRVDTDKLDVEIGTVPTPLMAILSSGLASIKVSHTVVAGRSAINAVPIAICAMDTTPYGARPTKTDLNAELVEYGFRRGVSVDLMQLSPNDTTPRRFVMNPVIEPGRNAGAFDTGIVGSFVCRGDMWVPRLTTGGNVRVTPLPATAPLANLYRHLNTRFDQFDVPRCTPSGAAPAFNIKQFAWDQPGGTPWMVPRSGNRSAASTTGRGRLETIADPPTPPAGTTAMMYGPLWVFARPIKYQPFINSGRPEPSDTDTTFTTADWPRLYPANSGAQTSAVANNHPYDLGFGMPYAESRPGNPNFVQSGHPLLSRLTRRILNVPLLQCPVSTGDNVPAKVLAVGRFFMTVPATPDSLIAEFGGVVPERSLVPDVTIYP